MNIFIDTTAFLAVLNANDRFHLPAREAWSRLLAAGENFFTSNYVWLETIALLQHRFGMEAVRLIETDIRPVVELVWVDDAIHSQAASALLLAKRRELSLVDCTSFVIINKLGLDAAFTFDDHYRQQGIHSLPEHLV